jgi:hypothetical protein
MCNKVSLFNLLLSATPQRTLRQLEATSRMWTQDAFLLLLTQACGGPGLVNNAVTYCHCQTMTSAVCRRQNKGQAPVISTAIALILFEQHKDFLPLRFIRSYQKTHNVLKQNWWFGAMDASPMAWDSIRNRIAALETLHQLLQYRTGQFQRSASFFSRWTSRDGISSNANY